MKNALVKDIFRDIKKSKGRFISIVAIALLGVSFLSGVKAAPKDMRYTADKYYDDYNLMDIRVLSTLGITDDDINAIANIDGVEGVFPTYSMDVLTKYNTQELVLKVHALPSDKSDNNKDYINRVNVIEGRLPEKDGECVVENSKMESSSIKIGDKLVLESGNDSNLEDTLKNTEYEVVGMVETPYYLSYEKGNSSIGGGVVNSYIMIPQDEFKSDIYTEAFVTVKGAKDLNSYTDKYFDKIDKVTSEIEGISNGRIEARYNEVMNEATTELNKGKLEYETKKKEVEDELASALNKIEEGKAELAKGEKELANKESEFNEFIRESEEALNKGEKELANGETKYAEGLKAFNQSKALAEEGFKEADTKIEEAEQQIVLLDQKISQLNEQLNNPDLSTEDIDLIKKELETTTSILQTSKTALEQAKSELESKKSELAKGEQELKNTRSLLDSMKAKLESEKSKLIAGKNTVLAEFAKARNSIATGKEELAKGEKEYEEGKKKADEELAKASIKIKDAEEEIKKIEKPKWYILDRNSHYSYVDYGNAADSIDAIAQVFPIFFFLVAALVCSTTMTRMVDEQRINIGTLKALGYSKAAIASKYIVYALLASLIGGSIGVIIGFNVFPAVVFGAYGIMYSLPEGIRLFHIPLAAGSILIAVLVVTIAAFLAVRKELVEVPSALMRPKAPKDGKRIIFERISFIWKRLNFTSKVTVRNIFRYKKRFFMTVFGIAGCTALLVTGFGIKDSIRVVVDRQFGDIFKYNMTIGIDKNITANETNNLINVINNNDKIDKYDFVSSENGKISFDGIEKDGVIFVPKNIDKISEFIDFRNRVTKDKVVLQDDGVILTEKIAKLLNAKVGDEINVSNSSDVKGQVKVTGIVENYLSNYAYMSPSCYEKVFGSNVEYNNIIALTNDTTEDGENLLSSETINEPGVTGVSFTSSIKNTFSNTIKSLNYVVLLLIVSAGALAFVVLYNLTNVNISERVREIATIKVLGFYDKEVSAYIYRENIILTLIGTGVGLGLGVLLHRFIMITVELENMMFGRAIRVESFIISAILTIVFSALVNFTMYYKLKNVKMVESLKSVD